MKKCYRLLDFCGGIGSVTLAAEQAGFSVVCAIGRDGREREVYRNNFNKKMIYAAEYEEIDIDSIPDIDCIAGRVSCFDKYESKRNCGRLTETQFLIELLHKKMPKAFVLVCIGNGYRQFADIMESIGYTVTLRLIDSREATGMPVYEKCSYMVGIRKDIKTDTFEFPYFYSGYEYDIKQILQNENIDDKYRRINKYKIDIQSNACVYNAKLFTHAGAEEKYLYLPDYNGYIRYNQFRPSIIYDGNNLRRITVRELARTKFYPDEFIINTDNLRWAYMKIGQSVNIYFFSELMEQVHDVLCRTEIQHESSIMSVQHQVCESNKKSLLKESGEHKKLTKKSVVAQCRTNENDLEAPKGMAVRENNIIGCRKPVFLSYCWKDQEVVNLVENRLLPLIKDKFVISRDIRDIAYKESLKKFMQTISSHEFVIMILSDRYLKSINCMYEVMEVLKDKNYADKLLFIVLSDADKKYFSETVEDSIAADIYTARGKAGYTLYWQNVEKELQQLLEQVDEPVYARTQMKDLNRIKRIRLELDDFFEYIADAKGLPLEEHLKTGFADMLKAMGFR